MTSHQQKPAQSAGKPSTSTVGAKPSTSGMGAKPASKPSGSKPIGAGKK